MKIIKFIFKSKVILNIVFLLLSIFIVPAVFAGAVYTISGDSGNIGATISIDATVSGQCEDDERAITQEYSLRDISLDSWGGSPTGERSIDFSNAQISVTLNGNSLSGTRIFSEHATKKSNIIILRLNEPITYGVNDSTLRIHVSGAVRNIKGNAAYVVHFSSEPTSETFSFFNGCAIQSTIQTKYVSQAAEERKRLGLPLEGAPAQVTYIPTPSQYAQDTRGKSVPIVSITPSKTEQVALPTPTNNKDIVDTLGKELFQPKTFTSSVSTFFDNLFLKVRRIISIFTR